jgi:hypothetical protein
MLRRATTLPQAVGPEPGEFGPSSEQQPVRRHSLSQPGPRARSSDQIVACIHAHWRADRGPARIFAAAACLRQWPRSPVVPVRLAR